MNFVLFDKLVESSFHIEAILLKKKADIWLDYNKQTSRDVNYKQNNDFIKKFKSKGLKGIFFYKK